MSRFGRPSRRSGPASAPRSFARSATWRVRWWCLSGCRPGGQAFVSLSDELGPATVTVSPVVYEQTWPSCAVRRCAGTTAFSKCAHAHVLSYFPHRTRPRAVPSPYRGVLVGSKVIRGIRSSAARRGTGPLAWGLRHRIVARHPPARGRGARIWVYRATKPACISPPPAPRRRASKSSTTAASVRYPAG